MLLDLLVCQDNLDRLDKSEIKEIKVNKGVLDKQDSLVNQALRVYRDNLGLSDHRVFKVLKAPQVSQELLDQPEILANRVV